MGGRDQFFDITFDAELRILHLRTWGFWEPAVVSRFSAAITAVVASLPTSDFDVLSESVDMPVQSQEVSELFSAMTSEFQTRWEGRTALAVKRMLNKLQVDRTMGGEKVRAFLTVREAMDWLRPGTAGSIPGENGGSTGRPTLHLRHIEK